MRARILVFVLAAALLVAGHRAQASAAGNAAKQINAVIKTQLKQLKQLQNNALENLFDNVDTLADDVRDGTPPALDEIVTSLEGHITQAFLEIYQAQCDESDFISNAAELAFVANTIEPPAGLRCGDGGIFDKLGLTFEKETLKLRKKIAAKVKLFVPVVKNHTGAKILFVLPPSRSGGVPAANGSVTANPNYRLPTNEIVFTALVATSDPDGSADGVLSVGGFNTSFLPTVDVHGTAALVNSGAATSPSAGRWQRTLTGLTEGNYRVVVHTGTATDVLFLAAIGVF